MLMLGSCLYLTSCSWLIDPASARRIGIGHVQYSQGGYFVNVGSDTYNISSVYTGKTGRDGRQIMKPVEGLVVTCFTLHDEDKVHFIVGNVAEETLEEYFTSNPVFAFSLVVIIVVCVAIMVFCETGPKKRRIVYAD